MNPITPTPAATQATLNHAGEAREPDTGQFPAGFVWGVSTAAYQIEGATRDDGRGPSIWDTFARTPGNVVAGHTGDVACEHYFRYAEDVALMGQLGLGAYRFSIAWPRVKPDGSGPTSHRGLDFYDRLVDALLAHNITPYPTLYHWDLPQALEDRGGWTVRATAEHFAEFAESVYRRLGDRIDTWTTLNEPWCSAFLGYAAGVHAPGRRDPAAAFAAAHHLLLAHAMATRVLRECGARQVGITLNLAPVVAEYSDDPHDAAAVRLVDGLLNRWFLDPLLRGRYPDDVLPAVARHTSQPYLGAGDLDLISAPIDLLGVNYYNPCVVAARPGASGNAAYPGTEGIEFRPATGPVTAMGWPIEPWGLTEILVRLAIDYPHVPLFVTENGAAFDDRPDPATGAIDDADRTSYLDAHLRAALQAVALGADLRGYLVWSLLDNFEWAEGYRKRFGLVYVDYATQQRVPKASAWWFRDVIRRGGLDGGG